MKKFNFKVKEKYSVEPKRIAKWIKENWFDEDEEIVFELITLEDAICEFFGEEDISESIWVEVENHLSDIVKAVAKVFKKMGIEV